MQDPTTPVPVDNSAADAAAAMERDLDAHADPDCVLFGVVYFKGTPREKTIEIFVAPMEGRQIFNFLKLARPMLADLVKLPSSLAADLPSPPGGQGQVGSTPAKAAKKAKPEVVDEQLGMSPEQQAALVQQGNALLAIVEDHGPNLMQALAVGVDAPLEQVGALRLPDLVTLLKHFIVVNAGFLKARGLVLPTGPLGFAGLANVAQGLGTPPPRSSP